MKRSAGRLAALVSIAVALATGGCVGATTSDSVSVLASWTGAEQAAFQRVLDEFHRQTGVTVTYIGTRDADNVLDNGIRTGAPPDVAVLSTPYELNRYTQDGKLVDLDPVLDRDQIARDYSPQWTTLMRAGTRSYHAIVVKATLKSLVWYDPQVFAAHHYQPPADWDQLLQLDHQIIGSGAQPWCLGLESTPASGWPGTDWIEDILLHQSGPSVYQAWAAGTLPWTSPEVTRAWQTWGQIVATPGAVFGGAQSALLTGFGDAGRPMFANPAGCYLDHEASFITADYTGYPGRPDFAFVPFPTLDPRYANAQEVAADLLAMFRDTPAARKLVRFLTSTAAQEIWPGLPGSGAVSVDNQVPISLYGTGTVWPSIARLLAGSGGTPTAPATLSFDASDLMPTAMQTAVYQAVLRYVASPGQLPTILAELEQIRTQAYG